MSEQPIRRGAPREERRFDQTQLKAGKFGYRVHRDYAAHFFKWGFATRHVLPSSRVLEVGCGQDLPLVNVLAMGPRYTPAEYLGVDMNVLNGHCPPWARTIGKFNFVDQYHELPQGHFNLGVCVEVIEHMNVEDGRKLLTGFRECLTSDDSQAPVLILSTPVFNGKAAKNHIHEYTVPELQQLLDETGWKTEERFGTFASYPVIKKVVKPTELEILEGIREFYSDEVAACFLAPLYPDHSRNNVWVLAPRG